MKNHFMSETLEGAWLQTLKTIVLLGELVFETEPFLEMRNLQISYHNAFEIDTPIYKKIFNTVFFDYMERVYSPNGDIDTGRNYYNLIYKQNGINQVDKIIKKLQKDPLSRSAVMTLITPGTEKIPCIIDVVFSIRQNLLQMNVIFKSSDFAKKFIPGMTELSHIHKNISQVLHIARGNVTAIILSARVYKKDLKIIQREISKLRKNYCFKTEAIIENWDQEAEGWDKNLHDPNHYINWENGYSRFLIFMDKELPLANKNTPVMALDSGCGTGFISEILNKKGYKVIGIDISPKMLLFAHKKEKERQYVLANSLDIPYENNSFDIICSRGVLISHVGKKYVDLFLREHNRVLKSGGLFMFDYITKFKESEIKKKKEKAYMNFQKISDNLKSNGFEILKRSGEDVNRVNAILCKKI